MIVGHWTLIIGHSRRAAARTAHGEGGIRTPDKVLRPYNGLANRRLQPLGHLSNFAGRNLAGVAKPRYPSVIHLTTPPARAAARCSRRPDPPLRAVAHQLEARPTQRFVIVLVLCAADVALEPVVHVRTRRVTDRALDVVLGVAAALEVVRRLRRAPRAGLEVVERVVERLRVARAIANEQVKVQREPRAVRVVIEEGVVEVRRLRLRRAVPERRLE